MLFTPDLEVDFKIIGLTHDSIMKTIFIRNDFPPIGSSFFLDVKAPEQPRYRDKQALLSDMHPYY